MAETGKEVTRASLQRALVVNALTKPLNVIVAASLVVVAVAVGASWLILVAAVVYAALSTMTFFDADEAQRVGDRAYGRQSLVKGPGRADPGAMAAPIASQLSAALEEETRIRKAIDASKLPFDDVSAEVTALVTAMGRTAQRAQAVYDYLASQDTRRVGERLEELKGSPSAQDSEVKKTIAALDEQLDTHVDMSRQLDRFYAEMEQTVAALSTIHAKVVRMGLASDSAGQQDLADQVRDLREQVDALSAGMSEAYPDEAAAPGSSAAADSAAPS